MVLFVTQKVVCVREKEREEWAGFLRASFFLNCAMVHGGLVGTGIERDATGVMVVMLEEVVVFGVFFERTIKSRDEEK